MSRRGTHADNGPEQFRPLHPWLRPREGPLLTAALDTEGGAGEGVVTPPADKVFGRPQ